MKFIEELRARLSPTGEITDPALRERIVAQYADALDVDPAVPLVIKVEVQAPTSGEAQRKQLRALDALVQERLGSPLPPSFHAFYGAVHRLSVSVTPEGEDAWAARP